MNKKLITAMAVLAVGASLAVAAPQAAKEWHGAYGRWHQQFAQKLNLTDAQKQQLRDLHKQFRQENKAFFDTFRQTVRQFRTAKRAGDTAKVDALKPTLKAQFEQMRQLRSTLEPKILSILTPAQQAQFKAMKAEAAARHQ